MLMWAPASAQRFGKAASGRLIDVACGPGVVTAALAPNAASVVAFDATEQMLEKAKARCARAGLSNVEFRSGDAESLPFPDGSFDAVMSTFGVMFTANQDKAAIELARVCKPGGRIGLANWTPESFIGQLFKTIGKYIPSAPGVKSPALWGTYARLEELFGKTSREIRISTAFSYPAAVKHGRSDPPTGTSPCWCIVWLDPVRCRSRCRTRLERKRTRL